MLSPWFGLSLYLAVGAVVYASFFLNKEALLGLVDRMRRASTKDEREDFEGGLYVGAQHAALMAVVSWVMWPWALYQVFTLWREVRRLEGRVAAEGRVLSSLTPKDILADILEERYAQVRHVFDDKLAPDERKLIERFVEDIAPVFGDKADEFKKSFVDYQPATAHGFLDYCPSENISLGVSVSFERAVQVASYGLGEVESSMLLRVSGLFLGEEGRRTEHTSMQRFAAEYWLAHHGSEPGQTVENAHWHGNLSAESDPPKNDEEVEVVNAILKVFEKIADRLTLCGSEESDGEVGPSA